MQLENKVANYPPKWPYSEAMISVYGDKEAMRTLGERIRVDRVRKNLTQTYLATRLGVSLPTLRKIEQGDGSVEFRHVAKALSVLGYAEALASIIPEHGPALSMTELLKPERKRARMAHPKTS